MSVTPVVFAGSLPGFEVGEKSAAGVILVQEWWGVTDIIKGQAELLASRGFRVLIPDLYKGKIGVNAEEAAHLYQSLDFKAAVGEIGQATKYLLETGSAKVGIAGFCMGGALSFAAAQHVPELTCTVPCYGIPPAEYFQIDQIKIPILGLFGAKDKHAGFADEASARAAEAKIKAAGGNVTMEIYPTGVHGFLNQVIKPEGPKLVQENQGAVASEEEVQAAWEKMVAFFEAHLKK